MYQHHAEAGPASSVSFANRKAASPSAATVPPVSIRYVSHGETAADLDSPNLTQSDFEEFAAIRHAATRARSLATRAALRALLSEAAPEMAPTAWTIVRDASGKPSLGNIDTNLHFSCSHTYGTSVVAVSNRPIGIDIESANLAADEAFQAEYFSAFERAAIAAKSPEARPQACARLWTLKEAVAKLLGTGLALSFSELEFKSEEEHVSISNSSEITNSELQLATWSLPSKAHPMTVALAVRR